MDQDTSFISSEKFLSGGGEVATLIRNFNWAVTSIGPISTWPQSLRTAINISLDSKTAVLIFWGKDCIRIYNDAYALLLGKGHPEMLGAKGNEGYAGTWKTVGPLVNEVFQKGVTVRKENELFILNRFGASEQCYFSYSYSPVFTESGEVGGVYTSITETTPAVFSEKRLRELRNEQLASLFLQAPVAICIFRGPEYVVETANERMLEMWGKKAEEVMNKPVFEGMPDAKGQGLETLLDNVYRTGERFVADELGIELVRNGKKEKLFVKFVYEALKEKDGTISAVMVLADEITAQVNARNKIEESVERLKMAVQSTRLGTWDYNPITGELNWSDECKAIYAFPPDKNIDFQVFSDHIYPEDKEYALSEIAKSLEPGGSGDYDIIYRILRYDDGSVRWIRATGKVYFNPSSKAERFIGTVLDITEQRSFEKTLRESEQRARLAIDASHMGTFDWDMIKSDFIYSDRLAEIFGYVETQGLQQSDFSARIHPDDKQMRQEAHDKSLETGTLFYEARVIWPDQSIHWVRLNGKIVYDEAMAPVKMYGTTLDVTEHKTIIRELEESEKRFKTVADTAPVMIWTSGTDKLFDFFNKGWLDFTGKTMEEEMENGWTEGIHPDDLERCLEIYNDAFEERKKFSMEFRLKRSDGKFRWVLNEGTPRYAADGLFLGYIGSCLDIHERKKAREELEKKVLERTSELNRRNSELKQQKEFVDTILDSSVDLIAVLDPELHFVTVNRSACEIYRMKEADLIGKKITDIFPIKESGMYDDLQRALGGSTVHKEQYKSAMPDKHFENFYIPLKDRHDEVYGILMIGHDNTAIVKATEKLKETNLTLEENNIALERSNKELESFSYVASHDLQEPLRKIRTFAELIRKNLTDEKNVNRYFEKIDASAQRMGDLIKAVLNYSRLAKTDEHFVNTDLNEILEHVKSDFELLISEKDVEIKSDKLPVIKGIPLQLNQLFSNLISNSIKFSETKPLITITSEIVKVEQMPAFAEVQPGSRYVEIIFRDNGIGFEQQYSNQIFTIFKRLHGNMEYTGTGIGLALCKKIVENHKGFISVQSEPGKGTEFFIYLLTGNED